MKIKVTNEKSRAVIEIDWSSTNVILQLFLYKVFECR